MEIIEAVPPRKHIDQSNAGRCFPSLNCILFVERISKMSIRSKPISNETLEAIDLGELPSSIALRNSNAIIDTIAIEVLQMANAIERSFMQKCSDSVTLALCGITLVFTESRPVDYPFHMRPNPRLRWNTLLFRDCVGHVKQGTKPFVGNREEYCH